jgi:hypothetical protein
LILGFALLRWSPAARPIREKVVEMTSRLVVLSVYALILLTASTFAHGPPIRLLPLSDLLRTDPGAQVGSGGRHVVLVVWLSWHFLVEP